VIAGYADPAEDVTQLGVVVEEPEQRFAPRAPLADAENIFRSGIEAQDEQVPVQQDDAGAQAVEDGFCGIADIAVVAGARVTGRLAAV
jgi:hypothetical protein